MNHFISLEQAKQMTALYRKEKENILSGGYKGKDILSYSETFDADSFLAVLNKPGCMKLRTYFGMSTDFKIHLITVGVNADDAEMLEGDESILETGALCPPVCPPPPPPDTLHYD
jgi:hypothetical protein